MKEIILSGSEYKKLSTMKAADQIAIFYDKEGNVLVYEKSKEKVTLPKIFSNDKKQFYSYLTNSIGIPFSLEKMNLFLQLEDYYIKFETENNKLKRNYMGRLREYYSCCVDFTSMIEIQPMVDYDTVSYPNIIPIDEAIERSFLRYSNSHTGYALRELQKVKKR